MTFPRISSLLLAGGGSFWAVLLLWYAFGFSHYSAGFTFLWALIWMPGFLAWYGYIRRVQGHFLLRRAFVTWLVSLIANSWSLIFMWSYFGGRVGGELPFMVCVALAWIVLAIVLSIACLIQEGRGREPKPEVVTQVSDEEFKRLLHEHRRHDV